jgi:phosphoglycolate phosphatase
MPMTLPYNTILFDLDGTLTDPKEGITKSIAYALNKMDIPSPTLDELTPFIGPPLVTSFKEYFQMNEEEAQTALQFYRERFSTKGLYENVVYDHIDDLLNHLKQSGYKLAIATSKPTVFAEIILKHFALYDYFDAVVGSELDGSRSLKGEVIAEVLRILKVTNKESCVMIGDRKHDVIGAAQNGIDSIGVTYGYGSQKELEDANATYIVHSVKSFHIIFGNKALSR